MLLHGNSACRLPSQRFPTRTQVTRTRVFDSRIRPLCRSIGQGRGNRPERIHHDEEQSPQSSRSRACRKNGRTVCRCQTRSRESAGNIRRWRAALADSSRAWRARACCGRPAESSEPAASAANAVRAAARGAEGSRWAAAPNRTTGSRGVVRGAVCGGRAISVGLRPTGTAVTSRGSARRAVDRGAMRRNRRGGDPA